MEFFQKKMLALVGWLVLSKGRSDRPAPFIQSGHMSLRGGFGASWDLGKSREGPYFQISTDPSDDRDVTIGLGGLVDIGMPEGSYTIKRPRWPFVSVFYTYNARPVGEHDDIPIPGKGENPWDCGPDSVSGQSGPGGLTDAIGAIYSSVLRTRMNRGGSAFYDKRPRSNTVAD